jgi:hypothetical protein
VEGRIDWGCVGCNPAKVIAVKAPEVPVVPGDRLGCLQHGQIDCERCGLLETRHRLALDEHRQDEATGVWVRDERGGGIGCALLLIALMAFVTVCGYLVWDNWPR